MAGRLFQRVAWAIAACASSTSLAAAGGGVGRGTATRERPTDDFGHEFVKVGRPGNRAALPEERWYNEGFENLGAVNYRYRMSKTEVTATQWLDFVNAYWPYWEAAGGHPEDGDFVSTHIRSTTNEPGVDPGYYIVEGSENLAVKVIWRVAARYANWLHNGQAADQSAFETGAYDTSTFGGNPQDGYTDQPERSPGSRFWLPSVDEWVKAAHYDPNRYGEGIEGYWLRMGGQNDPLTPGLPENGGHTSAGNFLPGSQEQFLDVGLYPEVDGPWGLLDTSGSAQEWTETVLFPSDDGTVHSGYRYVRGSFAGQETYYSADLIDRRNAGGPDNGSWGIRLASAVPSPGSAALIPITIACLGARRNRKE